jgi:pectinesterase
MLRLVLLGLISSVHAGQNPPAGALVVGNGGQYRTIQSAVDSAGPGKTIFVQPGTYNEQVFVQKKDITIMGASSSPESYGGNRVTLTYGLGADKAGNNDKSGTLRVHGDGFRLYNVNVVNSRGKGIQALALSAYGDQMGIYGSSFSGFQDTILSEKGHHIFVKTRIIGATDFIFGMHALAWFEHCDIKVLPAQKGFITGRPINSMGNTKTECCTASGRDSPSNPSWYVINKSDIHGDGVTAGAYYLGRPWRDYARVTFQNSKLGAVINKDGWSKWNQVCSHHFAAITSCLTWFRGTTVSLVPPLASSTTLAQARPPRERSDAY